MLKSLRLLPLVVCVALGCLTMAGCQANNSMPTAPLGAGPAPAPALQLPDGWQATTEGAALKIVVPRANDILIWSQPNARTPAAAVPGVAAFIVGEVKNFKVTAQEDLTLAGAPAKHLVGTGAEADDGDPSNAEVFLFTVGQRVYLACIHGEGDNAAKLRPTITKVLNTAKAR